MIQPFQVTKYVGRISISSEMVLRELVRVQSATLVGQLVSQLPFGRIYILSLQ